MRCLVIKLVSICLVQQTLHFPCKPQSFAWSVKIDPNSVVAAAQEPAAGVEAPPASLAANRAALLHDCNMAPYLSSPPVMQDKMQAVAQLNDTGHVSKCAQLDSGAGAAGWELPADLHKRWLLEFPWEVEVGLLCFGL